MLESSQVIGRQAAEPFAWTVWTVWTLVVSFIIDLESTEGWKKSMSCLFRNISGSPWKALACCTQQWPVEWPLLAGVRHCTTRGRADWQMVSNQSHRAYPVIRGQPQVDLHATQFPNTVPGRSTTSEANWSRRRRQSKVIGLFRGCWYQRDVSVVLGLTFNPYILFWFIFVIQLRLFFLTKSVYMISYVFFRVVHKLSCSYLLYKSTKECEI
jgi:hypothetical protein